jgi:uncharacterized membrane protein
LRALPADLAAVTVGVLLTLGAVFLPGVNETPLRVVFGLGFVLFFPGYAFIAALFPETGATPTRTESAPADSEPAADDKPAPVSGTTAATEVETATPEQDDRSGDGIDGIERVALSFGLSIAIVPLIGLALNFTPWGIRLAPIAVSIAGFTLVSVAVAAQRRQALPPDEQFHVPYRQWLAAARTELFEPESQTDTALNILLAASVILAVGSVGYAVAVPSQGEAFTEFYLLTENTDEELVADEYPENLTVGESESLVVGIENNEYAPREYTVVVQLQTVTTQGNTTTVTERTELDRFSTNLAHNETYRERHSIIPSRSGENLRGKYLLYDEAVPETPSAETAYRDLHLWVTVEEP